MCILTMLNLGQHPLGMGRTFVIRGDKVVQGFFQTSLESNKPIGMEQLLNNYVISLIVMFAPS